MLTLDRVLVTARDWAVTVVVYVGSVAASVVMHFVNWGPGASALVWIGIVVLGPALLAVRIGLPAAPSIAAWATLTTMYYVFLSLGNNSGYDTQRWDYGHLFDGLMLVLIQAFAAACVAATARLRRFRDSA